MKLYYGNLIASLEQSRKTLSKERLNMLKILNEYSELARDTEEAMDYLSQAIDALSRE